MRFPNLSVCNPQRPLVSHPALEMGHPGFLHLTHTKQIRQPKDGRGPLTPRVLTNGASHQVGGNTDGPQPEPPGQTRDQHEGTILERTFHPG